MDTFYLNFPRKEGTSFHPLCYMGMHKKERVASHRLADCPVNVFVDEYRCKRCGAVWCDEPYLVLDFLANRPTAKPKATDEFATAFDEAVDKAAKVEEAELTDDLKKIRSELIQTRSVLNMEQNKLRKIKAERKLAEKTTNGNEA